MSFSSSMGAGILWRKCSCRVAQCWELHNVLKAVAHSELRSPVLRVAQAELRNPGILEVAQAELRKRSCAIRRSCGIGLYSHRFPCYPCFTIMLHITRLKSWPCGQLSCNILQRLATHVFANSVYAQCISSGKASRPRPPHTWNTPSIT